MIILFNNSNIYILALSYKSKKHRSEQTANAFLIIKAIKKSICESVIYFKKSFVTFLHDLL